MHHLIRYAESEGLRDLHGDVLAANERMLKMCRELGFDIAVDPEDLALRKVRLKLPLTTARSEPRLKHVGHARAQVPGIHARRADA